MPHVSFRALLCVCVCVQSRSLLHSSGPHHSKMAAFTMCKCLMLFVAGINLCSTAAAHETVRLLVWGQRHACFLLLGTALQLLRARVWARFVLRSRVAGKRR